MIICQSIRSVLDRRHPSASSHFRPLATMSVVLLTVVLSLGMVSPTMARGGDSDGDGLANGDENKYGTDRKNPDTDGDGLLDGEEVSVSYTSPTEWDTDHDSLSDGLEWRTGTSPLDADSDNDRLQDAVETRVYFTDPRKWDTDGDDLNDYKEVIEVGTNPRLWDTDYDGMSDGWDYYPLDPTRH